MNVFEFLGTTKRVSPLNSNIEWSSFMSKFFETRKYPRYYLSSVDMSSQRSKYQWGIVPGTQCLVVAKWLTMGGIKIHLAIPPISLDSIYEEIEVLQWLSEAGVSARLSEEDVSLYGSHVIPDNSGPEFIYQSSNFTSEEMIGPSWQPWRSMVKKIADSGWYHKSWFGHQVPDQAKLEIQLINHEWKIGQGKSVDTSSIVDACFAAGENTVVNIFYTKEGQAALWSAYHVVHNGMLILLTGQWNPSIVFPGKDCSRYCQLADTAIMRERFGKSVLFSMGSGVGIKGLIEMKRKMRPVKELQMFRLVTSRNITKHDWNKSRGKVIV